MALTRLDCHLYRGDSAAADVSSFVAFNPVGQPSQLAFAGSTAARGGLGSQVAYRLALDYFVHGVEGQYAADEPTPGRVPHHSEEFPVEVLQSAFRTANSSVYSFGHKLAAGGRMAASLLGLVIDNGRVAAGRAGLGSVYLFRLDQLFPFFEPVSAAADRIGDLADFPDEQEGRKLSFVGANSLVDVELASVQLQAGDVVCAFSRPLTGSNETSLFECLDSLSIEGFTAYAKNGLAAQVCSEVFTDPTTLSFSLVACVGPEAVYCGRQIS